MKIESLTRLKNRFALVEERVHELQDKSAEIMQTENRKKKKKIKKNDQNFRKVRNTIKNRYMHNGSRGKG